MVPARVFRALKMDHLLPGVSDHSPLVSAFRGTSGGSAQSRNAFQAGRP